MDLKFIVHPTDKALFTHKVATYFPAEKITAVPSDHTPRGAVFIVSNDPMYQPRIWFLATGMSFALTDIRTVEKLETMGIKALE